MIDQKIKIACIFFAGIAIIGVIFLGNLCGKFRDYQPMKLESFILKDVLEDKRAFVKYAENLNINAGPIISETDAELAAKEIWLDVFNVCRSVKKISYDSLEHVWLIESTKKRKAELGGGYYLVVRNNGEVIALWGTK